jgi:hypothetical protein
MERERAIKLIGWICEIANLPEPIFPPHSKFREYGSISESGTGSCDIVSISPKGQKLLDDLKNKVNPETFKQHEKTIIDLENPKPIPTPKKTYLTTMQIAWLIYFSEDLKKLIRTKDSPKLKKLIGQYFENPKPGTAQNVIKAYTESLDRGNASQSALLNSKNDIRALRPTIKDLEKVIEVGELKTEETKRAKELLSKFIENLKLIKTDI